MNKKYPKQVFVQREKDGEDSYLLVWEKSSEVNDGEVAIYELVGTKKKSTQTVLE